MAVENVGKKGNVEGKEMVEGTQINWTQVSKETAAMKVKLVSVHEAIGKIWGTQKSRELATLESCVRNAVEYLDRIPAAAGKFGSKTPTADGKRRSILTKPR